MNNFIKAIGNHFYKPFSPLSTVLYLTNRCNLKCSFCEIGLSNLKKEKKEIKELSKLNLERIIKAMVEMHVNNLYITGGEPFLSQNFWYLIDLCINNSINVNGITTNGTTLNKLTNGEISKLHYANLREIIISLDHATAEKHDDQRGKKGVFDDIERFLKSEKSSLINTNYCISSVVSKKNYKELADLIELSYYLKIDHINFQPVCLESIFVDYNGYNSKKDQYYIEKDFLLNLEAEMEKALRRGRELKVSSNLSLLKLWVINYFKYMDSKEFFFNKVIKRFICSKPYNYLHINYNGDLLACTHIGPLDNINNNDIKTLWLNNAIRLKKVLTAGKYFNKCRNCFCDFPTNYRWSLLYKPYQNITHLIKNCSYYYQRYLNKMRPLRNTLRK